MLPPDGSYTMLSVPLGKIPVARHNPRLTASLYGMQRAYGSVQQDFEWFYVYGAVASMTGERLFLELQDLNAERFARFVDAFADSLNLLLLDNSGPIRPSSSPSQPTSVWCFCRPTGRS
jgi:hypothetical protein